MPVQRAKNWLARLETRESRCRPHNAELRYGRLPPFPGIKWKRWINRIKTGLQENTSRIRQKKIDSHGLTVLKARHPDIKQLETSGRKPLFGFKPWKSSWLLIDYLGDLGLPRGYRILELGCGWGLAGIYCAKQYGADVTGLDNDSSVFPYLNLHAEINSVRITTRTLCLENIEDDYLKKFDMVLGADICFTDKLVNPLTDLIDISHQHGIEKIVLTDPGRTSFHRVAEHCLDKDYGQKLLRKISRPFRFEGYILDIDTPNM